MPFRRHFYRTDRSVNPHRDRENILVLAVVACSMNACAPGW